MKQSPLIELFPLMACVNLARRKDRWQSMQARLSTHQISGVQRFDAVDGATVEIPSYWRSTPGAYGCLRSHVGIVEAARAMGVDSVLIFEDDVEFADDFVVKLTQTVNNLPNDWQILYLGAIQMEDPQPVCPGLQRISKAYSTYAYAIHHSLFDDFIALNHQAEQPLDVNQFILQRTYNCYCTDPFLAWVEIGYSDAQEKMENHWYLRESLILFGHCANQLLAKTCVVLVCDSPLTGKTRDNLNFLLDYYQQFFQGFLSVCVVEQGKESGLEATNLPPNTQSLVIPSQGNGCVFEQAVQCIERQFDYYVFSGNNLYLEAMDFRANLRMCQRYGASQGFSALISLDGDDTDILINNSHARALDLRQLPKKSWQQISDIQGRFLFIKRTALDALWQDPDLNSQTTWQPYQAPNYALRLCAKMTVQ